MHIEKNFFDNLMNTVLNIQGKTKDNLKSRLDLVDICDRSELHVDENGTAPFPIYRLDGARKEEFFDWITEKVKFPDGYASNLGNCVDRSEGKFTGLKSHDCHVIMQRLLPFAFSALLPRNVHETIAGISVFFRDLCSRVVTEEGINNLKTNAPVSMCNLEKIFPPSFFDVMEHLAIHLARELELGGPVQYRWMYIFERYMHHLKKMVKNQSRVEGSIVAQVINEETAIFAENYFPPVHSRRKLQYYDPFILASQADQVCYISYPRVTYRDDPWVTVTQINPRGRVDGTSVNEPLQPDSTSNLRAVEDLADVELVENFTEFGLDAVVHSEDEAEVRGSTQFRIPSFCTPWRPRFDKSSNGISRSINNMMYSMLHTGYSKWSVIPRDDRELWFRQFAQEFTWESGLTETVRQKFNEKAMDSYTKQINAWKTVWQKNKRPRYINGTVWEQLIVHWEKNDTAATSLNNSKNQKSDRGEKGMYVHNLGACSMSSKEDQLIEANDGNPVDRLQLIKEAHTNKKTGQIQDAVIRSVVDLVET
ncbi:PREDICTED: uncharacterized protein LOC106314941 [Brassica oleracea var. oleracea]|uniref:uncharacterized protein LOC106314941 n=1 Tax=Brassica oleracea var. oleracea TaxID=109376 RepID=UPI0006A73B2B|nr:PREDICTED: uncharacterized protein LOC106314941 [Brassica oleracea var. oleracea]